jgi:hypothetical protein
VSLGSARRKQWSRPSLVVLARSTPQEAVLAGCKGVPTHTSAFAQKNGCMISFGTRYPCVANCSAIAGS